MCFTAPPSKRAEVEAIARLVNTSITRIGSIISEERLFVVDDRQRKPVSKIGFDHFVTS